MSEGSSRRDTDGATQPVWDLGEAPLSLDVIGGKSANTVRVMRMGLSVPPGFCIGASAYRAHVERNHLGPRIGTLTSIYERGDRGTLLAAIRDGISDAPLDQALADAIVEHYELLDRPVAVRSSATIEDQSAHSFAGQHGTYFAKDAPSCLRLVRFCWASLFKEGSFSYREAHGYDHQEVAMAVLVQPVIYGDCSGVLFTADPVTGDRGRVVIESCFGLGEALVAGKVVPDRWVLERDGLTVIEEHPSEKACKIVLDGDGGVHELPVGRERRGQACLPNRVLGDLAKMALAIEREFGGAPQDIEWTYADGAFVILQARPITSLPPGPGQGVQTQGTRAAAPIAPSPGQEAAAPAAGIPPAPPTAPVAEPAPTEVVTPIPAPPTPASEQAEGASAFPPVPKTRLTLTDVEPERAARMVWTNLNAGEVLPDVASPMTWSLTQNIVDRVFACALGRIGLEYGKEPLYTRIGGRFYFCLTTFAGIMRAIPGFGRVDYTDVFGGYQQRFIEAGLLDVDQVYVPSIKSGGPLRVLRLLAVLSSHSPKKGLARAARMRAAGTGLDRSDLSGLTVDELVRRLHLAVAADADLDETITFAAVGMMYFGALFGLARRWLGDEDGAIASRLLSGLGAMDSAESGMDLWRLAEFAGRHRDLAGVLRTSPNWYEARRSLSTVEGGTGFLSRWDAFMERHGHHTRAEVDVRNPRWSETPDYVMRLVSSYLDALQADEPRHVDPVEQHRRRRQEREDLLGTCMDHLGNPIERAVLRFVVARAQAGSVVRENVKSEAIRRLAHMRRLLLEIGQRLTERRTIDRQGDVFFLYLEEVAPAVTGTPGIDVRGLVAKRRGEFERNLMYEPPPVVVGSWDPVQTPAPPVDESVTEFRGLAVSPGQVTGRARVILRADSQVTVEPGEILIAPFSDPGWAPYFIPAAGIVMDMGGLLSHGSIVAREYGKPAVANVGPATQVIKDGRLVQVDGNAGIVRIMPEADLILDAPEGIGEDEATAGAATAGASAGVWTGSEPGGDMPPGSTAMRFTAPAEADVGWKESRADDE